jgi:hypothetical protein
VLRRGELTDAIVAAVRDDNPAAWVEDHGAYVRVHTAEVCVLRRATVEHHLGHTVHLRRDLEPVMISFLGRLEFDDDDVRWRLEADEA